MFKIVMRVVLLLSFSLTAFSGASVDFKADVAPLLQGHRDLERQIEGLVLSQGAGDRISFRMCPALSGRRVGPYVFPARDPQHPGQALEVIFETHVFFRNAEGAVVAEMLGDRFIQDGDIFSATSMQEDVTRIVVH